MSPDAAAAADDEDNDNNEDDDDDIWYTGKGRGCLSWGVTTF